MKRILITTIFISSLLSCPSCQKEEQGPVLPQQVIISASSICLTQGGAYALEAIVLPANSQDKSITWTSTNNSIATVSEGKVKALSIGKTVISATTINGKTATCDVSVVKEKIPVTGISLNKKTVTLNPDDTFLLTATITPETATDTSKTWRTDNERVAVVVNGTIKAIDLGKAIIYVISNDGGFADSCVVSVKGAYDEKLLESTSERYSPINNYSWD